LSCGASVDLIRAAKAKGLPVTADVAMHQLHLTEQLTDGFNSLAHVRPPLRSEQDKALLRQGVKEGVIDAICAFDTYVALGVQLIQESLFEPLEWVEKVTSIPAQVANMTERWQKEAGWVLVDPELEWVVSKETILSQGKNTPLLGQTFKGKAVQTFI